MFGTPLGPFWDPFGAETPTGTPTVLLLDSFRTSPEGLLVIFSGLDISGSRPRDLFWTLSGTFQRLLPGQQEDPTPLRDSFWTPSGSCPGVRNSGGNSTLYLAGNPGGSLARNFGGNPAGNPARNPVGNPAGNPAGNSAGHPGVQNYGFRPHISLGEPCRRPPY